MGALQKSKEDDLGTLKGESVVNEESEDPKKRNILKSLRRTAKVCISSPYCVLFQKDLYLHVHNTETALLVLSFYEKSTVG